MELDTSLRLHNWQLTGDSRANWCKKTRTESFVASVLVLFIAFAVRRALQPYLDDHIPTLTFMLGTFYIAWIYGFKWGLVQEITGFLVATYFFVKPYDSFAMPVTEDLYRLFFFFGVSLLVIILFEKVKRNQYEAELYAKAADEHYMQLVEADRQQRQMKFSD